MIFKHCESRCCIPETHNTVQQLHLTKKKKNKKKKCISSTYSLKSYFNKIWSSTPDTLLLLFLTFHLFPVTNFQTFQLETQCFFVNYRAVPSLTLHRKNPFPNSKHKM